MPSFQHTLHLLSVYFLADVYCHRVNFYLLKTAIRIASPCVEVFKSHISVKVMYYRPITCLPLEPVLGLMFPSLSILSGGPVFGCCSPSICNFVSHSLFSWGFGDLIGVERVPYLSIASKKLNGNEFLWPVLWYNRRLVLGRGIFGHLRTHLSLKDALRLVNCHFVSLFWQCIDPFLLVHYRSY